MTKIEGTLTKDGASQDYQGCWVTLMKHKLKLVVIFVGLLIAGVVGNFYHQEPTYHGRNLSDWLGDYVKSAYGSGAPIEWKYGPSNPEKAAVARGAVSAIGTNAIPVLLELISKDRDNQSAIMKLKTQA